MQRIPYCAIQNGFDALFVTAAELIDDLSRAFRDRRFADALVRYTGPDVLVVDEVGYLTYGTDAANMLFHVVNERHKRKRSMIFTTNKQLGEWGRVLHDNDLAHAIVDRVLERGRLLTLDGPSMRTKHLGLDDPTSAGASTQVVRISGISRPEFPEPTHEGAPKFAVGFELPGKKVQILGKRNLASVEEAKRLAASAALQSCASTSKRFIFRVAAGDLTSLFYVVDLAKNRWGEYPASVTACPPADRDPPAWDPPLKK
jgi:hypothetical protein